MGSRLLRAAEDWLYYCPVHFAGQSVPCYGNVEGPRPPLFGSTQRMGVNAQDQKLLHFLSNRGYAVTDPGDVSMHADIRGRSAHRSQAPGRVNATACDSCVWTTPRPFVGSEPPDRQEYASLGSRLRRALRSAHSD